MFCKFCGNQIPDGEVCFCEQAVAQRAAANQQQAAPSASPVAAPAAPAAAGSVDVNAILGKIVAGFKGLLKDTFCASTDMTVTAAFAVTGLLMHILAWLCLKSMLLGDILKMIPIKGVTGTFVWCGCLSYLVPLVCYVLIPVVGSLIRKAGVDIKSAFGTAAAASVVPSALFLLGGVIGLVIDKLGFILIIVAVVAGINTCAKLASCLTKGNSALSVIIVAVAVAIMVGLTAYVEYSAIKEFISSALSGLMSGLLGGMGGLGGLGDLGGLFG